MTAGPAKGRAIEARYTLQGGHVTGFHQKIGMTIDGWTIKGCAGAPVGPAGMITRTNAEPVKTTSVAKTAYAPADWRPLAQLPAGSAALFQKLRGATMTARTTQQLQVLDADFRRADTDKNGRLDLAEFAAALHSSTGTVKAQFARLDADHDGALNFGEYLLWRLSPPKRK